MRIAVFGATGGTGRQFVIQALGAGHEIVALVRDRQRLDVNHQGLAVVEGNVLDQEAVRQTIAGTDAVLCSLGNTANNPELVVSQGTRHIVDVMQHLGSPRRILVVTALGVGDSWDQVPPFFKAIIRTALRKAYRDKEEQEAIVRQSGLDWIILRPGGLGDGPATGQYAFGLDPTIKAGQVSRADVAAVLVRLLSDDTYLHQTPAIA